jgi:hypothetical protein
LPPEATAVGSTPFRRTVPGSPSGGLRGSPLIPSPLPGRRASTSAYPFERV